MSDFCTSNLKFEHNRRARLADSFETLMIPFGTSRAVVMGMAKLFTRDGSEFTGKTQKNDAGKLGVWQFSPCTRCGGAGGFKGWPGFTCFRCGGQNSQTFEQHFERLYTAEQLAKLNAADEKRNAKKAAKAEAAEAARLAKSAAFVAEHAALVARCESFKETDTFIADVLSKAVFKGSASPAQLAALDAACTRLEARKAAHESAAAASQHVGTIGERINVVVTVTGHASYERERYMSYGQTENVHIVTMTDDAGNVFVSKSPSFNEPKGERFTLRATVKEHGEYKGVKQTVVTRATRKEL
jgi:hypothetical protein